MNYASPAGPISESTFRVRYAETDAMGIVHHSRYLPWFEIGRTDWMRQAGLTYAEFEAMGFYLTVVEAGIRYQKPARYDDLVTVRTWLAEVRSRGLRIDYEVVGAQGDVLVTGFTRHICITHDGTPVRLPEVLVQTLERYNV